MHNHKEHHELHVSFMFLEKKNNVMGWSKNAKNIKPSTLNPNPNLINVPIG
jgi:hypothetical protein